MVKPKKSVEQMRPYVPPLEGRRGFTRLDFNENTKGPSIKVLNALKNLTATDLSTYPEYDWFKKKLAKYLNIIEGQLVLTNGSDEAIKLVIDTFVEHDEEIIIPIPTYPMYKFYADVAGIKATEISFDKDLSFPVNRILESIGQKTKIVVLVNPNSPTGSVVAEKDLKKILLKSKNCIILLDEAYFQYSKTSFKYLIKDYPNLVIIQTFSKAFGLAGLRLGYIIASVEHSTFLNKANSPYSVNVAAISAAMSAIENDSYVTQYINEIDQSRSMLQKVLNDLKLEFIESSANFTLINFGDKSKKIHQLLKQHGILVRDQSDKELLKGFIRITLGTVKETQQLIEKLKEVYP